MWENEESRIRRVYADRDSGGKRGLYHWSRPDVLLNQYRFRSVSASILSANGFDDLASIKALDVGCGSGGWIRTLLEWGARAENLCGVDLLQD
ncbi:MAG: SAM-dependent methyltransferase, partial [Nitrospinae bacterium]|nr:SAM-dependent methyltransferase [Nitrospinota bacterium]